VSTASKRLEEKIVDMEPSRIVSEIAEILGANALIALADQINEEKILAVGSDSVDSLGVKEGVTIDTEIRNKVSAFVDKEGRFFRRGPAEKNPKMRQPIPYIIVYSEGHVLLLTRLKKQGEKRLHGKKSIGVGGHINPCDEGKYGFVVQAAIREIEEELDMDKDGRNLNRVGLIKLSESDVDRVHLGVLFVVRVPKMGNVRIKEKDKMEGGWCHLEDLADHRPGMEAWSQLLVDEIAKGSLKGLLSD